MNGGKPMKNRLYYFLLPVYLFVVGFVLMVNGVFSGQVTSVGNLAINLTFLLLIGILFRTRSMTPTKRET